MLFTLQWLRRQAEARKVASIDDPDLAEHEKDPVWLKDKAGWVTVLHLYLGNGYRALVCGCDALKSSCSASLSMNICGCRLRSEVSVTR